MRCSAGRRSAAWRSRSLASRTSSPSLKEGDERACSWSVRYESVIGFGTISELVSPEEKDRALACVAEQQAGRSMKWATDEKAVSGTRVWRLDIEAMTAKRSFKSESK
jgi:nitroimidazol reductase NimA-like FMN-containing flavoprotein (pyridoxamine 5'-phosphate oxidase superfamily)